jgi:hypothetical protein
VGVSVKGIKVEYKRCLMCKDEKVEIYRVKLATGVQKVALCDKCAWRYIIGSKPVYMGYKVAN